MQGMSKLTDLCFLKVEGRSQLRKEIEETKMMPRKQIDFTALHRNEITQEVEGKDGIISP